MITLVVIPGFWKEAHEADQSKKGNRKVCRGRRAGFAARCKSRSQDRPYPRNTHLYLEERQGRSGETVKRQQTTRYGVQCEEDRARGTEERYRRILWPESCGKEGKQSSPSRK